MSTSIKPNSPLWLICQMGVSELAEKRIAYMVRTAEAAKTRLERDGDLTVVKSSLDETKRITQFDTYSPVIEDLYRGRDLLESLKSTYKAITEGNRELAEFCLGSIVFFGRPYANKHQLHEEQA